MWPPPEVPATSPVTPARPRRRRPDAADSLAVAGAAAVVSSLLLLPWFTLSFRWLGSVSVSFEDLRGLFSFAKDNGFDADMRYFYVEWGYLLSYLSAAAVPVLCLSSLAMSLTRERRVLAVASGITAFAGVGQAIIAAGLTSLDETGSVRFGLWWGVAGHVALAAACVMAANRDQGVARVAPRIDPNSPEPL